MPWIHRSRTGGLTLLTHGSKRDVHVEQLLIGDPLQLPPTLPGNSGVTNGLDRTLFERLHDAGQPTTLLGIQYRVQLHPPPLPTRPWRD